MERREFLAAGLATGMGLPIAAIADDGQRAEPKAIAEGGPLSPPKDKPIQVAIAVSAWNTWIDFVGPEAVFQTFRYDPVEKRHKPLFNTFFVGEKLEPMGHLVPDYTFETAPAAQVVL